MTEPNLAQLALEEAQRACRRVDELRGDINGKFDKVIDKIDNGNSINQKQHDTLITKAMNQVEKHSERAVNRYSKLEVGVMLLVVSSLVALLARSY